MNGYAFTIIRKSMLDEVRRLRCMGRTGLGLHPVDTIDPLHRIVEDAEDATSDDEWSVDDSVFARDGQENRYAAHQIAQRAFIVLTPEEWSCVSLAYGFDGGGIRTPTQVAREAGLPRKKTQELLDGAMEKMKALT
jgi:DNA-directed RNA polymerase sigma subunit (sigma70/sigma32)